MVKKPSLDVIIEQLNALSLPELLQVRAKVNALIEEKSLNASILSSGSYQRMTSVSGDNEDIDITNPLSGVISSSSIKSHLEITDITLINNVDFSKLIAYEIARISKLTPNKDDSLEKLIDLVDEWMDEESGYDEESYPQIEAALNQNRPS
ncbi:MAG TPA: hypothetical protein V6D25_20970 [Leptolyngbyaceae cyanobacterium]